MKYWILAIFYLLLSTTGLAQSFSLSPGVSLSSASESDQLGPKGQKLLKLDIALGFNLDAEVRIYKGLYLLINGQWLGGEGKSQYHYTNKKNPLVHATFEDMKSNYSMLSAGVGGRYRFLEVKGVVAFVGYLYHKGKMILSHDENQFLYNNYSKLGFIDKEEQSFNASSFEFGLELFPSREGKLHFVVRKNKFDTESFETLNQRKVHFQNYQLLILYRHSF